MSQHSQRTQHGPSRASVAGMSALTGASALATGYLTDGPMTRHTVIGVILGVLGTVLLVIQTVSLISDRAVAQDRMAREEERERYEQEAERERQALDTGHWLAEDGRSLTVRWDPAQRRYRVQGWMFDDWEVQRGLAWGDAASLARSLIEVERAGLVPVDGEGARAVRARLMMPGWDGAEEPSEAPEPPVDEGPVVHPSSPDLAAVARWAEAEPYQPPRYAEMPLEPAGEPTESLGYRADPVRPWRAFEPSPVDRAALSEMSMPLSPRSPEPDGYVDPGPYSSFVPVSPGRAEYGVDCDGTCGDQGCPAFVDRRDYPGSWPTEAATEVIGRVGSEDETQVIPAQS